MKKTVQGLLILAIAACISDTSHAYLARYAGYNEHGQAGVGDTDVRSRFEPLRWIPELSHRIRDVAIGRDHMIILLNTGGVLACGDNTYGQLGVGPGTTSASTPMIVIVPSGIIVKVACGNHHTLLLSDEGKVYAFGRNDDGQLGLGDKEDRFHPTETIPNGSGTAIDIACGGDFSAALLNDVISDCTCGQFVQHPLHDHVLFVCGDNDHGQLATGNTTDRDTWTLWDGYWHTLNGMACGQDHVVMWNASILAGSGRNDFGQLGLGDTTDRHTVAWRSFSGFHVEELASGDYHLLVRSSEGDVYACGHNAYGQLGLTGENRTSLTVVPDLVESDNGIGGIAAGGSHSFFFLMDGRMKVCGRNNHGQLGLGPDYAEESWLSTPTIAPGIFGPVHAAGSQYDSVVLTVPTRAVPNDYDGDGKSDPAVFAESTRSMYLLQSTKGFSHSNPMVGVNPTAAISGDYDGDGIIDRTFFQSSTAYWLSILSGGEYLSEHYGWDGVQPVPGDYDGDGIYDLAVFFPWNEENWFINESGGTFRQFNFGWIECEAISGAR